MRKKITSFIILVVLFVNIGTVSVNAGTVPSPSVKVGSATGKKGDIVEIPIVLENNKGFSNLGIEISYNPEIMKLINVVPTSGVGASFTPAQYYTKIPYNMDWSSAGNTNFNGTLAVMHFEIISDNKGVYPIELDYYKGRFENYIDGTNVNYDENRNPLNLAYADGEINVIVENTITLNEDLSVSLSGEIGTGVIYAALYDGKNQMKQAKIYDPEKSFDISFESPEKGDFVKVMWWDSSGAFIPIAETVTANLINEQSDSVTAFALRR